MKLKYIFTLPLFFSTVACSDDSPQTPDTSGQPDSSINVEKTVTIDAGQSFQTLTGFGASDCWAPAFVGKSWITNRDKISELLFSSEIQSGQPKGIGLSMWRVNLGGGSAEQGEASGIEDKSRRAESYLTDDLTLDWTALLLAARQRVWLSEYSTFQQYPSCTIYLQRKRILQ